jgi:O-Antigen ligase
MSNLPDFLKYAFLRTKGDFQVGFLSVAVLVAIGVAAPFTNGVSVALWAGVILYCGISFFIGDGYRIWYGVVLSPGLEIISRLGKSKPLPDEMGKYFLYMVIVFFILGRFDPRNKFGKPKYRIGGVMLACLVPSIIYAAVMNTFNFQNWIFNLTGVLQLSILLLFASRERWTESEFYKLCKIGSLPIVPIVIYITIKTPKFEEIDFDSSANFSTTGGFGSNQVSTILGVGFLIMAMFYLMKKPVFQFALLNIGIMAFVVFRGLLTFSRGGILVALFSMVVGLVVYSWGNRRRIRRLGIIFLMVTIAGVVTFKIANSLTHDALATRYSGEDKNAAAGQSGTNINKLTSNRSSIALTDLKMFNDYFLFGVGPGESRYHRKFYGGFEIIPHTEYTRLLSEHGIGGLFEVILLSVFPFVWLRRIKSRDIKALSAAFYVLAVGTSFHAAMRTNTTVVFYLLASLPVIGNQYGPEFKKALKKVIARKQIETTV